LQDLNKIKDTHALSHNIPQKFQEFVAFFQWLDDQIMAQEAEKGKPAPQNTSTTQRAPPITHTPSTVKGTHSGPMDLRTNQRTLISEECQKRILEQQCLYCEGFGHVAWACSNKCPYGHQLHKNEAHIALFQFNVSTMQTAPVVVNAEAAHMAPPSSKSVKN
jgi:hypothetical protein